MTKPRVYVTRSVLPEALDLLRSRCHVDVGPSEGLSEADLIEAVRGADAVVATLLHLSPAVMEALAPTCKIISSYGVGYDHIPVEEATRLGMWVTHNPDAVTTDTADLAWALILGAARKLRDCDLTVRNDETPWGVTIHMGLRVSGKALGIVGSGRIALAVAKRAQGFGMRLSYTGRRRNEVFEAATGAQYMSKEELLASSDFVSLHIPLTEGTRHYISTAEFALMRPHAILINTARGPIVDEEALVIALKERHIAGAGLDVFEHEPHAHPELRTMNNVLMTPHRGVATIDSHVDMGESSAQKIFDALDGRLPQNCLNPQARKPGVG